LVLSPLLLKKGAPQSTPEKAPPSRTKNEKTSSPHH
jgi:hypothetical protein